MQQSAPVSPGKQCPVCGGIDVDHLLHFAGVPVHCNLLWPTREQARQAPRGDVQLGFCSSCGHIFNLHFDARLTKYSQAYENSLYFSPRFREYAERLARRLVRRYHLYGKDVIEIGCGQGDFLTRLCVLGGNRGIGFDPGYRPDGRAEAAAADVRFIRDVYSARYAAHTADFVCARHVLEHLPAPRVLLATLGRAIGERTGAALYFEVPNALFTLQGAGVWDLIYEHPSYFSAASLARLFATSGFEIVKVGEAYHGQFLFIEAVPARSRCKLPKRLEDSLETVARLAAAFAEIHRGKVAAWQERLRGMAAAGRRVVVWGAGSKGVTFLNTLSAWADVQYIVDINPRKQGMYVAGTGQRIVPPEFLRGYQPDALIVMNPIYFDEIRQAIEGLCIYPELIHA
jgi:SAM-dependent methyltransferase